MWRQVPYATLPAAADLSQRFVNLRCEISIGHNEKLCGRRDVVSYPILQKLSQRIKVNRPTGQYGVSGGFVGTIWLHVAKDSVNITDGIEESAWLLL